MDNVLLKAAIRGTLQETHNGSYKGQPFWTKAFKNSLLKLGEANKFKVYPSKKSGGQWLVDLCWAIEEEDWKSTFHGLKLACEIEWSKNVDEIISDFQKLTVIDAEIRLMIFQYDNKREFEEFIKEIKAAGKYSKSKGYNYLIAASGNNGDELKFGDLENM